MLYIKKDERKQMKNVTDLIITKQREETILFWDDSLSLVGSSFSVLCVNTEQNSSMIKWISQDVCALWLTATFLMNYRQVYSMNHAYNVLHVLMSN